MHRAARAGVERLSYKDGYFSYVCRRASYGHRSFSYRCRDRSYAVNLPGKPVFHEKDPYLRATAPLFPKRHLFF